jgi:hypothetical protein
MKTVLIALVEANELSHAKVLAQPHQEYKEFVTHLLMNSK